MPIYISASKYTSPPAIIRQRHTTEKRTLNHIFYVFLTRLSLLLHLSLKLRIKRAISCKTCAGQSTMKPFFVPVFFIAIASQLAAAISPETIFETAHVNVTTYAHDINVFASTGQPDASSGVSGVSHYSSASIVLTSKSIYLLLTTKATACRRRSGHPAARAVDRRIHREYLLLPPVCLPQCLSH